MPATPALSWRVSWQVWPATPEAHGGAAPRRQPKVHHRDFADEASARNFAQLLTAAEARQGGTCLTSIQNLTPRLQTPQPAPPGTGDFPWRACKAPSP
jgi:hypothetical protein